MWTRRFWFDAGERATKTAAQALIVLWGADGAGLRGTDWTEAAWLAGGGFLLSLLMSVSSTRVGDPDTASMVRDA